MPHPMTDEEARELYERERPTELWGVPVPEDAWVGPGAVEEFDDGRGADDDGE